MPKSSIRELLVKEAHEGGLMGHFRVQKTLETLHEHFYWPHMKRDMHKYCEHCIVRKKAKSKVKPRGLYQPLPVFLIFLGLTYLWILCWDCLQPKVARILFL